jgi:hypothetical protein
LNITHLTSGHQSRSVSGSDAPVSAHLVIDADVDVDVDVCVAAFRGEMQARSKRESAI